MTTIQERNAEAFTEANAILNKMAQDDPTIRALLQRMSGPSCRYYGPTWNKLKHNDRLYTYSTERVRHGGRVGFGSWVYRVQGLALGMSRLRVHRLRKDAKARAKAMWEKAKEGEA